VRRVAVYIGTTAGPVQIERITHETIPQSIVCLKRTSTVLAISSDYHDFVRLGSGIVARDFGLAPESVFRLDLSAPVNSGRSWQLAVYVAHAIDLDPDLTLCQSDETPDRIIWLSGEVDHDGRILPVQYIPEKFQTLLPHLEEWDAAGIETLLVIPQQGENFAIPSSLLRERTSCLQADDITHVSQLMPMPARSVTPFTMPRTLAVQDDDTQHTGGANRRRYIAVAMFVVVACVLSVVAYVRSGMDASVGEPAKSGDLSAVAANTSTKKDTPQVAPMPVRLTIYELRANPGDTCALVHFGRAKPSRTKLADAADKKIPTSKTDGLCGLDFDVSVDTPPRAVRLDIQVKSGTYLNPHGLPKALTGSEPIDGTHTWTINLPRKLAEPLAYTLTLYAEPPVSNRELPDNSSLVLSLTHSVLP